MARMISAIPFSRQLDSRNAVTSWTPGVASGTPLPAATSVSNHFRDRPGGKTAARHLVGSLPAVKPLAATARMPGRVIKPRSTLRRTRRPVPQTSLPWQRTEIPATVGSRPSAQATGSKAR